jgi:hypothetical protein
MSRLLAYANHVASGIDGDAIRAAAQTMLVELAVTDSVSKWKDMARKLADVSAISTDAAVCMAEAYRRAASQQIFEN